MKKITKLFPAVVIGLSLLVLNVCTDITEENSENPYKGQTLTVKGQQVWQRNSKATKVSQAYIPYNEEHEIEVFVEALDDTFSGKKEVVGSGDIKNDYLTFSTNIIDDDKLLEWKYEIEYNNETYKFNGWNSFFREWPDADISDKNIKGNMLLLDAYSSDDHKGMLDRQKITGTASTITCETVLYIYVTGDCRITGTSNSGYTPGQYYYNTKGNLNLSLKKGLNLICRSETYGTNFSGSAVISMEVKNPLRNPENYKWVIEPGFGIKGIHFSVLNLRRN